MKDNLITFADESELDTQNNGQRLAAWQAKRAIASARSDTSFPLKIYGFPPVDQPSGQPRDRIQLDQ